MSSWRAEAEALRQAVTTALRAAGRADSPLQPDDLAALDQVHTGGRRLTLALAELAQLDALPPGACILDVGGGVGGAARTLAARWPCRVIVVERAQAYCTVGAWLTARTGLDGRVHFVAGDARALPLTAACVDVAWVQHVALAVHEKTQLFTELARVLRPGGLLALHELVAGPSGPPYLPAPWARTPADNAVVSAEALRTALVAAGFTVRAWRDATDETLAWFNRQARQGQEATPGPLGVHLLLGPDTPRLLANTRRSLAECRLRAVLAVATRSTDAA